MREGGAYSAAGSNSRLDCKIFLDRLVLYQFIKMRIKPSLNEQSPRQHPVKALLLPLPIHDCSKICITQGDSCFFNLVQTRAFCKFMFIEQTHISSLIYFIDKLFPSFKRISASMKVVYFCSITHDALP